MLALGRRHAAASSPPSGGGSVLSFIQKPAPKALAPLDDVLKRAAIIGAGGEHGPRHRVLLGVRTVPGPNDTPGARERVGEPLAGAQPPQRDAEVDHSVAEMVYQREWRQREPCFGYEPPRDLANSIVVSSFVHTLSIHGAACGGTGKRSYPSGLDWLIEALCGGRPEITKREERADHATCISPDR